MNTPPTASSEILIPVAWLGRTSTEDAQDPTLSLPRQLRRSRAALPPNWVIVAHYYDVESGRKDLGQRGRGLAHERFDIPIPRDGGVQDLLDAAARRPRRFAAVICESIERVARRTYFGTKIEYELERCGITLCAADEPLSADLGARKATPTLTRRVKQAVAEWYVLQMLELSHEGAVEHTRQGWNIGKPLYGYLAETVPHPVPAKRAEGRSKHRLVPHPVQGPVVTRIFELRVAARLGYDAIADRLNLDLRLNPPPEPTRPSTRLGRWTASAVREVLTNPKYTGYMVYNRRSTKNGNKLNPDSAWVWSPHPVHEPLVTREHFDQAATLSGTLRSSRAGHAPNSHPATKTSYLLRSFLWCALCGRRMWGKTHPAGHVYYVCEKDRRQHHDEPWFEAHPTGVRLRADRIEPLVHDFLATHLPTANRPASPTTADNAFRTDAATQAARAAHQQIAALQHRQNRLIEELEILGEPHHDPATVNALRTNIYRRFTELSRRIDAKNAELTALGGASQGTNVESTTRCTETTALADAPLEAQRAVFDAHHLAVRYDYNARSATVTATISGNTLTEMHTIEGVRRRQNENKHEPT